MKNHWIEFFYGTVLVKVKGNGNERFLNRLTREGFHIWNARRSGTESIIFRLRLRDALKIRPLVRNSDCKVEFLKRSGGPFLMKRGLKNFGFLLGGFSFIFLIMLLSNVVWGIEIKGAKPATEYQIRKELDKMGLKVGSLQFFVKDVEGIQRRLTNNIEALTWVGVELEGTTYHFQVVEKNQPNQPEVLGPRHLIANKKALIVKMFVEEGQPVTNINEYVQKGQLLVSGLYGKEGKNKVVAAKGTIYGETWYKSFVELPLVTNLSVYSGKEKQKHSIELGSLEVPVWGFGDVPYKKVTKEQNVKIVKFLNWELPLKYKHITFREREDVKREYSNEEAVKLSLEMAKNDIKKHIPEDAIIKDDKILHKVVKNGKVELTVLFRIIENIAVGQPIVQGDE